MNDVPAHRELEAIEEAEDLWEPYYDEVLDQLHGEPEHAAQRMVSEKPNAIVINGVQWDSVLSDLQDEGFNRYEAQAALQHHNKEWTRKKGRPPANSDALIIPKEDACDYRGRFHERGEEVPGLEGIDCSEY